MKLQRRRILFFLLMISIATWLVLWWFDHSFRPPANFSLIEENLYLGGSVEAPPTGTTAVLNLCEREDPYRCEVHAWEAIADSAPAPNLDWLADRVAWIDKQQKAGRQTYVHCRAGVSRGGMVVCAYLMYKNHWTRDQALEFVRSRRPQVRPNPAFMSRLLEWEGSILDKEVAPATHSPPCEE